MFRVDSRVFVLIPNVAVPNHQHTPEELSQTAQALIDLISQLMPSAKRQAKREEGCVPFGFEEPELTDDDKAELSVEIPDILRRCVEIPDILRRCVEIPDNLNHDVEIPDIHDVEIPDDFR